MVDLNRSRDYKAGAPAGTPDANGYLVVNLDGQNHYAHELAWRMHYGTGPNGPLVLIDGNKQNLRINNLREATADDDVSDQTLNQTG